MKHKMSFLVLALLEEKQNKIEDQEEEKRG
jgi:hypothetical protein